VAKKEGTGMLKGEQELVLWASQHETTLKKDENFV
jgi:hypothetical protein